MDETMMSTASSNSGNGITNKGGNKGKKSTKKIRKLTPLEESQLSSKGAQLISKVKAINNKRELIEAVRKVAPASIQLSPTLFHDISGNLKTIAIDDEDVRQQLSIVEDGVNNAARRYNDLRVMCDRRAVELKVKLDELDSLKLEHEAMDRMKKRDTEEAQRIDVLKVQIEEVENDIIKLQHYRRQLNHMLARLKKNQIKFDAHMNGMEDTYLAVKHEWEECRLMRRNLDSGLSRAELVYEECYQRVQILRHERQTLLGIRRDELKNAHKLKRWLRERAVTKMALATELRGDLTKEEEVLLRTQLKEKEEKTKKLQRANEESQRKVQSMDDAFMKIKQITGMTSLDDMLEKFTAQKINKKNLEKEHAEVEVKLNDAKKMIAKVEQSFQERKSSGVEEDENNRGTTTSIEEKIQEARNIYKITKAGSDRLNSVLIALKQGAHGLLQRVHPYLTLVDVGVFELTASSVVGDENDLWAETMDSLSTAEQVLSKMLEIISGGDAAPTKLTGGVDPGNSYDFARDGDSLGTEPPSMATNVRIRSRRIRKEHEEIEHHPLAAVPSAGHHVSSKFNSNGNGNLHDDSTIDSDSYASETTAPTLAILNTAGPGSGNGLGKDELKRENVDEDVCNRNSVKKQSTRISADAARKEKEATRIKRISERMGAVAEGDESALANMAKLKAQQSSSSRLSVHHHPPTLPPTVTLRDDPMTKTQAFLTCMPDLK